VKAKTILITGASRGVGEALSQHFSKKFNVIRVSRSAGEMVGDISDIHFRQKLLELTPHIVINNAALYPDKINGHSYETNLLAAIYLAEGFAKKETTEHVINISSVSGLYKSWNLSWAELHYKTQKNALSDFTETYSLSGMKNKVKMSAVELGYVDTDFANIRERAKQKSDIFGVEGFPQPMSLESIVSIFDYLVMQPFDLNIGLIRVSNHFRRHQPHV